MPVTAQPREIGVPPGSAESPAEVEGDSRPDFLHLLSTCRSADRDFKPGEHLYTMGEPCDAVHILVRGWAYLFSPLADGRQIIFQFGLPGMAIGFHPEPQAIATCSARALTELTMRGVSYEQLRRLFHDSPDAAVRLMALLAQDRKRAFDRLTSTCRTSARRRVAQILLDLATDGWLFAPRMGAQDLIVPVTQEHIADTTGLSTVHVNRVLSGLRRDRIVEFQHRRLRVLSFAKLRAAAAGDEISEADPLLLRRGSGGRRDTPHRCG